MLNYIRYAFRTLRQNPGFTATAVVSIALAIGANSAIFSLADAVVLRPLPVPDASQLVSIRARMPDGSFGNISYPDYVEFRDKSRSFDGLVAYSFIPAGEAKDARTQPELKWGMLVSGDFFKALRISPPHGRGVRSGVVVLSNDLWRSEFAGDPSAIGRTIRLNGSDFTVIGVTSESFTGIHHMFRPAFYIPAAAYPDLLTNRARREFFIKGRLQPGVSVHAADGEIAGIGRALEEAHPATNRAIGAAVRTELQTRAEFSPGDQPLIGAFALLVIVVLLIACANVANLLLNRGHARTREIAVRLAVGAGRTRIAAQLMVESLILALLGGGFGLLIAQSAAEAFSTIQIPGDLPLRFDFQIDYRVLAFTLVASMATAVLFGLAPALHSTRVDLVSALKAGDAEQIAGSLFVLVLAGQLYRTVHSVVWTDRGFRIDHRITIGLDPSLVGRSPSQTEQFYRTLLEKARNAPGVRSVALVNHIPLTSSGSAESIIPEGYSFPTGQDSVQVSTEYASEDYFQTLGVPVIAGRGFLLTDRSDSPFVGVVNQEFARHYFNNNALGKRFRIAGDDRWIEIVGVTVTGQHYSPFEPPLDFVYLPLSQHPRQRMMLAAETYGDAAAMSAPLREIVRSIDPEVPIFSVRTMEDLFDQRAVKIGRLLVGVVGALAAIGLTLALVGLYAVVAYQVGRRTREIGVRMALGALRLQVMRMVLKQAALMAGAGLGVGIVLSFAGRGIWSSNLFGPRAEPLHPMWLAAAAAALFATTLAAAAIPARRAARIDPQQALRQE
jgi:macrolide transport system ATP-binding/permease protein